jgi:NAD(P)-dependent dehydrogenase (short-subunit alcohol dehydrogenase family)
MNELKNKTVLITGSTDGIGRQCAIDAAKEGACVIVHGREKDRLNQTILDIKNITQSESIYGTLADFTCMSRVKAMANEIKKQYEAIDILINNAAELINERVQTEDGYELQFQVNYLAHFLLTEELLPMILKRDGSRIINISSMIHSPVVDFDNLQGEKSYSGSSAYAVTKTLNILHAYSLADIYKETKIGIFCVHPGVIQTKLLKKTWTGGAPVSEGADNVLYVAKSEALNSSTGLYIENRRPMQSNPVTYDQKIRDRLRAFSLQEIKKF